MKKNILKLITLFCAVLLTLPSCMDEDIIVPANTSFPLGQLNYTDSALFELAGLQDIIKPNYDGILSVFSEDSIEVITPEIMDTLFKFQAQNFSFDVASGLDIPGSANPGTLYDLAEPILFEVPIAGLTDGERIDKITFADCNLRVNITNAPSGSSLAEAYWEIVELTELTSPAPQRTANKDYNISGCTLNPMQKENADGTISHTMTLKITGKVPPMAQFIGSVAMDCKKIQSMTGNVGRKVIDIAPAEFVFSDKLQDFSERAEEVFFANPVLTFEYDNTFDVPITLQINEVKIDGNVVNLSQDPNKTTIAISPKSKGVFVFDNSNTANNDLSSNININTKQVSLSTTAIANPESDLLAQHIITNQDRLDVVYRVDLALEGYVKGLEFEKTYNNVKFGIEDIEWQEMVFAFTGTNSILMDFDVDLYLFDVAGQPVLITSSPIRIPAALSETEPVLVDKNKAFTVLTKSQIEAIEQNQKLMIKYRASTKDIDNHAIVRLLAQTGLNLNLLVGAKAEIKE